MNIYQLATIADATVNGGADVPYSNNGVSFGGITHTAGTTTMTLPTTCNYDIKYNVSFTAGIGAQIALAVNGTVLPESNIELLVGTGQVSGHVIYQALGAGDVLTLRNNSATPFTMALAPAVSAQLTAECLDP
jgi:hypothetical protein